MNRLLEQYHRDLISGKEHGLAAMMLRNLLNIAEPFYASAMAARNVLYDLAIFPGRTVPRPVISIGNMTTGGTGKTPVVRWVVQRLRRLNRRPAILLRGYRGGDEQRLLEAQLPDVIVQANPDRIAGAHQVLLRDPTADLFVLDDGFQHRRIKRNFDLLLIDATNPFGYGHVLPRGLRREPMPGLGRAHAFLITHADRADPVQLTNIESVLHRYNKAAPIFRCRHVHEHVISAAGTTMPITELRGKKVIMFCGIANPLVFQKQIEEHGACCVTAFQFNDHHSFSPEDLSRVAELARTSQAEMVITTEKDWVKLQPLMQATTDPPPIWRTQLTIQFDPGHEDALFELIQSAV